MEKIQELLDGFDGELYNLCYKLLVENKSNEVEVFQYMCENYPSTNKNEKVTIDTYFTKLEIDQYTSIYRSAIEGILISVVKKCNYGLLEPEYFYSELWKQYCINFISIKERAFAFYETLTDKMIPYRYVGKPLIIDKETFDRLLEQNENIIEKLDYIFATDFNKRTEIASLILGCLNEVESHEAKTMVLVRALSLHAARKSLSSDIDAALRKRIDIRVDMKMDELFDELTKEYQTKVDE